MTLQDAAHLAQIVSGIAQVLFLTVSTTVAVLVYRWHRSNAHIEAERRLSEDLRHYNNMILEDEELQDIEVENHPHGNLDRDGVKRMYKHFIRMNISMNLWEARRRNAVSEKRFLTHLNNLAMQTYRDRDFIMQHVLPRGYPEDFRELLLNTWQNAARRRHPPAQ